jgi:APA family basic amino acid/polyamine antiporter
VTFAAAEVQNPRRNLPLALRARHRAGHAALRAGQRQLPGGAAPSPARPTARSVLARGIAHATQDRVGTAMAEAIFGPGAGVAMAIAILVSTFGLQQRADPRRGPRLLGDGPRPALLPQGGDAERQRRPRLRADAQAGGPTRSLPDGT